MNYNLLKQIAQDIPGSSQDVADVLNSKSETVKVESFQTMRSLLAGIGLEDTNTFMSQLEEAAPHVPGMNRVLYLLKPSEGGVDVGDKTTYDVLNTLKANGLVNGAIIDKIIGLGEKKSSIAEINNLGYITAGDVQFARTL